MIMSMVTRCPHCTTLFRVTPAQLQAQRGSVRCGRCMRIFNGFESLATAENPAQSARPPVVSRESPPEVLEPVVPEHAFLPSSSPASVEDSDPPPVVSMPPLLPAPPAVPIPSGWRPAPPLALSESGVEKVVADNADAAHAGPRVVAPRQDAKPVSGKKSHAVAAAEADGDVTAPPSRRRGGAWSVGALLMGLVLVLQATYFYRTELTMHYPSLKPLLVRACEAAGCAIALPQAPKLISIEASDLQALDPDKPGIIRLTATLRSQAPYPVAYPALDLVLTNTKEHTLARRIFPPRAYLAAASDAVAGIAPSAEVTVRLDLDTGDLGAVGFRLDLLAEGAGQ